MIWLLSFKTANWSEFDPPLELLLEEIAVTVDENGGGLRNVEPGTNEGNWFQRQGLKPLLSYLMAPSSSPCSADPGRNPRDCRIAPVSHSPRLLRVVSFVVESDFEGTKPRSSKRRRCWSSSMIAPVASWLT